MVIGSYWINPESRIQISERSIEPPLSMVLRVVQEVEENGNWDCRDRFGTRVLRGVESGKQERLSLQDSTRTKTIQWQEVDAHFVVLLHHRHWTRIQYIHRGWNLIHRLHCRTLIMHYKSHIVYEDFDTSS